jgi:hypothetical protein
MVASDERDHGPVAVDAELAPDPIAFNRVGCEPFRVASVGKVMPTSWVEAELLVVRSPGSTVDGDRIGDR